MEPKHQLIYLYVQTVDKSSPKISKKKVDPSSVLADIAKGETKLKHTETVDKSSPVVESMSSSFFFSSSLLLFLFFFSSAHLS